MRCAASVNNNDDGRALLRARPSGSAEEPHGRYGAAFRLMWGTN